MIFLGMHVHSNSFQNLRRMAIDKGKVLGLWKSCILYFCISLLIKKKSLSCPWPLGKLKIGGTALSWTNNKSRRKISNSFPVSCFPIIPENSSGLKLCVFRSSWIFSTAEQNGALLIADYQSEIPTPSIPPRFERSKPLNGDLKQT